jgi:hypothetical protein
MVIQWGPTTPLVVDVVAVTLVAPVVASVAALVVILEAVTITTMLEIATPWVTVPDARSMVIQIIWHHSAGISMMTATRWMRSLLQRWPLRHPTPSTQTGTLIQARRIISQVIPSVWLCVRSIKARIKSKLPVDRVCLFKMLAILFSALLLELFIYVISLMLHKPINTYYLCTGLHEIIMSFLKFTHFIFLSRMLP